MKDNIKKIVDTKQFHIFMVSFIIIVILAVAGLVSLKYHVEGDNNLPFNLSKISIISSIEGEDNTEDKQNKWNLNINQNNDIYLYINKNEDYKNTEIIENITLNNFKISKMSQIGEIKLYKPDDNAQTLMFLNKEENETNEIIYQGNINSNIKDLKIANQGGLVVFRYAINNVAQYISNEDEQINHGELLKKLNINEGDLKFNVSFDMYINLNSKKSYKANIKLELPLEGIVEEGMKSQENIDLKDIVFKRI